jgi:hypothetical protein
VQLAGWLSMPAQADQPCPLLNRLQAGTTLPCPPSGKSRPKSRPRPYHGPTAGRLIWNGSLNAWGSLQFDAGRASTGHLTGTLPEVPVKVKVHPASFTGRGIEVFANELPSAKERRNRPVRTTAAG